MSGIENYKIKMNKARGKLEHLQQHKNDLEDNLSQLERRNVLLQKAQAFIQDVAKNTQEKLRYNIVDIVNLAINACFPNIVFDLLFGISNNRTNVKLLYKKDGYDVDPMNGSGGGLVDLTAFALRIAAWKISHTDNVIILDEPLKWLQPKELQIEAFNIIKMLSKKIGIQFIISSNSVGGENLIDIADKKFRVSLSNQKINDKTWKEVSIVKSEAQ